MSTRPCRGRYTVFLTAASLAAISLWGLGGEQNRKPTVKGKRIKRLKPDAVKRARAGGSEGAHEAVGSALDGLTRHQNSDGSWPSRDADLRCDTTGKTCRGRGGGLGERRGRGNHDVGVTGLAMLAFTRFGHTHDTGQYGEYVAVLARALAFLKKSQIRGTGPKTLARFTHKEISIRRQQREGLQRQGPPDRFPCPPLRLRPSDDRQTRHGGGQERPEKWQPIVELPGEASRIADGGDLNGCFADP